MKLVQLYENWGHLQTKVDDRGPDDHLVGLRTSSFRNMWLIFYNGENVGSIADMSSKWVHEDYKFSFDPTALSTPESRVQIEKLFKRFVSEIKAAKTARKADKVIMPVDPSEIAIGEPPEWAKKKKEAPKAPKMNIDLPPRPRVKHSKFGEGDLIRWGMSSGNKVYTIKFDDGSIKKIQAQYIDPV